MRRPIPGLDLGGARQRLLERATLALGLLDSVSTLLPEPQLFLYAYVRREAVLRQRPVCTLGQAHVQAGMSFPTAAKVTQALVDLGMARELTGQRRNRIYVYGRYLDILNGGSTPL